MSEFFELFVCIVDEHVYSNQRKKTEQSVAYETKHIDYYVLTDFEN